MDFAYTLFRLQDGAFRWGFASAVWTVTLACSSADFEGCKKTKTCESGESGSDGVDETASASGNAGTGSLGGGGPMLGESGAPGEGSVSSDGGDGEIGEDASEANESSGSGGSSPAPAPCTSDSDCNDGVACNGDEVCENGTCVAGEAVECENSDTEHCRETCVENDGDYECQLEAVDADGDGHGSALCEASPGDDCNDDDGGVHPGAEEVCDGVDNDCNGTLDLEDDLALGGRVSTLPDVAAVDVAWSPAQEHFGVAHVAALMEGGSTQRSFFLGMITGDGEYEEIEHVVDEPGAPGSTLRVSWGDDHWTLWENRGPLGVDWTQAHHVDAMGHLLYQTAGGPAQGLDAVYRDIGDWLVVSEAGAPLRLFSLVSSDMEAPLVERDTMEEKALFPRIAAAEGTGAAVWQRATSGAIMWALVSEDLEFGEPEELAAAGQRPRISALPNGYALTWATDTGFGYETRTLEGDPVCGPVSIEFGDGVLDDTDTAAPAATNHGVVVVATDRGDALVELYRFDADCEISARATVGESLGEPVSMSVASGGNQLAVSWTTKGETGDAGHVRAFSSLLCD